LIGTGLRLAVMKKIKYYYNTNTLRRKTETHAGQTAWPWFLAAALVTQALFYAAFQFIGSKRKDPATTE
jgi:hypothetical protein